MGMSGALVAADADTDVAVDAQASVLRLVQHANPCSSCCAAPGWPLLDRINQCLHGLWLYNV